MTQEERAKLAAAKEKWENEVRAPYVETHPERRKKFTNDIELEIKPLYTPLDLEERGFEYEKDLGFPGQYPWTRGIVANGNRSGKTGDFSYADVAAGIYTGFGIVEYWNERIKKIISWGGMDEIRIAIDLPTQCGYDSDHLMARGEVGRTGLAVDTLQDMEILYDGVEIDKIPTGISFMGNSWGPLAMAFNIALAETKGLNPSQYRFTHQNDPLKEFFARGTYIVPIKPAIKLACDCYEWCILHAPHWIGGYLCSSHINGAGAGSLRAAAYAILDGFEYMNDLTARGYTADQIMPNMAFFLDEREDFFVTVCMLRACRKLWAKFMKERYNAGEIGSRIKIQFYPHGGETLQEPINNIMRIGFEALACYLGGANLIQPAGYDEAMGTPDDRAAKLQLRTTQIINNELGFNRTIDPLAGSYYVESLTIDIADQIEQEILKVEKEFGGAIGAINARYYQGVQTKNSIRRQEVFEAGERLSVGVNIYPTDEEPPKGALRMDPKYEEMQVARLKKLKESRDNEKVQAALAKLKKVSENNENTVDAVVEAVRVYATLGEICDVWREVYGEYSDTAM